MANMQESSPVFFSQRRKGAKSAKYFMCFYLQERAFCFFFAALASLRE